MGKRARPPISAEELEAERARATQVRAIRATEGSTPAVGDLWSIRSEIVDPVSGQAVEHSWAPVVVAVWRDLGIAAEVIPVSFDLDLAGRGDLIADEPLFDRRYMLECWLRMPVFKGALARRFAICGPGTWARLERTFATPSDESSPELDDARLAYRQSERLRVLFAAAGAAARLAGAEPTVDTESHEQKRAFAEKQSALIDEARALQRFHPAPAPRSATTPVPA